MADNPRGFVPYKRNGSACWSTKEFELNSTHDAIGKGDALELRADGYTHQAQASSTTIIAVAAESKAANAGGNILAFEIMPGDEFICQSDDATIAAQTNLNLNYNITVAAPDSRGISQMEIDGNTGAATKTLPVKVTKLFPALPASDNAFGANGDFIVRFNELATSAGGDGI